MLRSTGGIISYQEYWRTCWPVTPTVRSCSGRSLKCLGALVQRKLSGGQQPYCGPCEEAQPSLCFTPRDASDVTTEEDVGGPGVSRASERQRATR
jgi:hypothetical protein